MNSDESAAAIVRASVNLARDLGLVTVGEGIEDDRALRTLAGLGCNEMQGFLICRPLPIHDLVRWVREWSPASLLDRLIEPSRPQRSSYLAGVGERAPVISR